MSLPPPISLSTSTADGTVNDNYTYGGRMAVNQRSYLIGVTSQLLMFRTGITSVV
jgi:hypothetical protein